MQLFFGLSCGFELMVQSSRLDNLEDLLSQFEDLSEVNYTLPIPGSKIIHVRLGGVLICSILLQDGESLSSAMYSIANMHQRLCQNL